MPCTNPNHIDEIEKLDGTVVCGHCAPAMTWDSPFHAVLLNEAGEPHAEIEMKRCTENVTRNGLVYRLVGFDVDGATYRWCAFDPSSK